MEAGGADAVQVGAHPRRWLQLLLFCAAAVLNAVLWITYSPIPDDVQELYDVSPFYVNLLSVVYFIAYVPGVFVASWLLDVHGLRAGLCAGVGCCMLGSIIRAAAYNPKTFPLAIVGQSICAIGQPFIQNAPTKVAGKWFPDTERAVAVTIATVANPIGAALGLVIPPLVTAFVSVPALLVLDAVVAALVFLLIALFFRSKPPLPPSYSALEQDRLESQGRAAGTSGGAFLQGIKTLATNPHFLVVFVVYSLTVACFQSLATLAAQILAPFAYSNIQSGALSAVLVVSGVLGSALGGKLMDRFRAYRLALLVCYAAAAYSNVLFCVLLAKDRFVVMMLVSAFFGFVLLPTLPLSVALAAEVSYPVPEATPIGFMVAAGMIASIAMIAAMSALINNGYVRLGMLTIGAVCALSYVMMCTFRGTLKRWERDQLHPGAVVAYDSLHDDDYHVEPVSPR
eukprot:TRINITY_DN20667_c0_g1_i1.p1 TRINITY_DN20667_c0_g1~~TRINITY_DN20667_c0_g1_i1.p1  ORF type:complete len:455 (+),score=132.55 TRINITY_DN20667_c0_g1_i1:348-1712(+)